jgi:hypothetical protein
VTAGLLPERVTTVARRTAARLGRALLALLAVYLVARAVVEVVTVDPSNPETYRRDWGGPHYLGVMLVHAGPGVVVANPVPTSPVSAEEPRT